MNNKHGILIRTDTQTVSDVHAVTWNGNELRKVLLLSTEAIVYMDVRNDSIVVRALANIVAKEGKRSCKDGFELLGQRFYGNALIVPDEGRDSPKITPQEVAHTIHFFQDE